MSSLEAVGALNRAESIALQPTQSGTDQVSFEQLFADGLDNLSGSLQSAETAFVAMAMNKPVSTHEVMLTMEKAKMELRLAVEIRNKLLEGYQEIMRMQV